MEHSPWEPDSRSPGRQIVHIKKKKIHYIFKTAHHSSYDSSMLYNRQNFNAEMSIEDRNL